MNAHDEDTTLTMDKLCELIKDMPPKPTFIRVVVGAPLLPEGKAFEDRKQQILWIHNKDWEKIPKDTLIPDDAYTARFCGVPIEMFNWEWHEEVWRNFLRSLYIA